ncbi:DUF6480 family protein [Mycolicibacterium sp.]|uniref:DUF6480 family protein n=1 Tax=Mycolicibacterium sp. TaxID=2320850 RepID=UPI003D0DB08F
MSTALPPDPDPGDTPGEERAGGVAPGETPPDSAQTRATANADPVAGRNLTPRAVLTYVAIAVFLLLFVATAVLLIAKMAGAFG